MTRQRGIWVVVAALAALLVACGGNDSNGAQSRSNKPQKAVTTTPPATTAPPATTVPQATTVKVATASIGQILVDQDGKTLYLFDRDQGTTTACTGGCATTWPALTASAAPTGAAGVDQAKLTAGPNGQVVYNGHLLYRYAGDSAVGQTNGNGIGGIWHAVTPQGTAV